MKDRKKSYFKKVGDSLPKIVNKNISERSFVELSLIKNWNKIIGKEIACYCWPIKMIFSGLCLSISLPNTIIETAKTKHLTEKIEFTTAFVRSYFSCMEGKRIPKEYSNNPSKNTSRTAAITTIQP